MTAEVHGRPEGEGDTGQQLSLKQNKTQQIARAT